MQENLGRNNMKIRLCTVPQCLCVFLLIMSSGVLADTCPSAMDVKNRNVPDNYEWTVSYEMVLSDLLAVTRLYAVAIENSGAFVSCKYESPRTEVRLDGISKTRNCLIVVDSGNWFTLDDGRTVCQEEDTGKCQYKFQC